MKKLTQILGLIGLVALGLGFFALLIGRQLNIFIELHLLIGGGLALFGLLNNIAGLREYFSKRNARAQSGAALSIGFTLVVILLIFIIANQHNWLFDVTKNHLYTLEDKTKQTLKDLPDGVKITAFLPTEGSDDTKQLFRLFEGASKKIRVEVIDPDRHPEQTEAKSVNTYGTVIFEYNGREARVVDPTEEDFLNSLIRVTRAQSPVIYFITGHAEADPDQQDKGGMSLLKHYLEQENFQIKKLQISTEGIPNDARLIVIAGPRGPYQPWEITEIDRYLGKGGDAIFMLDAFVFTGWEYYFDQLGVHLGNGVVVDQENYMVGMDAVGLSPVVSKFGESPITQELDGKLAVFPRVRPLVFFDKPGLVGSWTPLVWSSEKGFVETDLDNLLKYGKVERSADKPSGAQVLAASYEEKIEYKPWEKLGEKKSSVTRMVLFGNSHFARNLALEVYSNYMLALNAFNWTAGEQEFVPIRPKKRAASRIYLTQKQTDIIFYSTVLVIPELLCILGIAVWWRRK